MNINKQARKIVRNTKPIKKSGACGVVSLVTGILGLITLPLVFSTTAIITGAVAMAKKEKFGLAGLVMGIIGWTFGFIAFYIAFNGVFGV